MSREDEVILVDENDNEIGTMPKLAAHRSGALHRAFSVFLFNSKGELLLQKRAEGKYHSAGLWSNTCCSHPRPGEQVVDAAVRRLHEEMGLTCSMKEQFSFIYKADLDNGLTEHEFDHVLTGISDTEPKPDAKEVSDWIYRSPQYLHMDITAHPENYTAWFVLCFNDRYSELFAKKQHDQ